MNEDTRLFKDMVYVIVHKGFPENVSVNIEPNRQRELVLFVGKLIGADDFSNRNALDLTRIEQTFVDQLITELSDVTVNENSSFLAEHYITIRNYILDTAAKEGIHPLDVDVSKEELRNILSTTSNAETSSKNMLTSEVYALQSCFPKVTCTSITLNNWGATATCISYNCAIPYGYNSDVSDDGGCEWVWCDILVFYSTPSLYRGVYGASLAARCVTGTTTNEKTFSMRNSTEVLFGGGSVKGICGLTGSYMATWSRVLPHTP